MRKLALLALVVVMVGCSSASVEGPKAYRVWDRNWSQYLSDWLDSKEAAKEIMRKQRSRYPHHVVNIVTASQKDVGDRLVRTGRPDAEGVPQKN